MELTCPVLSFTEACDLDVSMHVEAIRTILGSDHAFLTGEFALITNNVRIKCFAKVHYFQNRSIRI